MLRELLSNCCVNAVKILWSECTVLILFYFRINLDCIQSEANALSKRLRDAEKKVSSSVQDVKDQFLTVIQVSGILCTDFLLFVFESCTVILVS